MTHLSQIVCEHVAACPVLKVLKQAHVSCCGCRVTVGGIPLMQGEMVVVNSSRKRSLAWYQLYHLLRWNLLVYVSYIFFPDTTHSLVPEQPVKHSAQSVFTESLFFFYFPLTTQPFIQMYLISLQWHSSLNSQSSRIWWPGARKVQVAVRQTWQM